MSEAEDDIDDAIVAKDEYTFRLLLVVRKEVRPGCNEESPNDFGGMFVRKLLLEKVIKQHLHRLSRKDHDPGKRMERIRRFQRLVYKGGGVSADQVINHLLISRVEDHINRIVYSGRV